MTDQAEATYHPQTDLHLIWGFLLKDGEPPDLILNAIHRLLYNDYPEEEVEEQEPEPKPKQRKEWSPEAREAAAQRMRDRIASGKLKPGGRKPAEEPEGNQPAPSSDGADPESNQQ